MSRKGEKIDNMYVLLRNNDGNSMIFDVIEQVIGYPSKRLSTPLFFWRRALRIVLKLLRLPRQLTQGNAKCKISDDIQP